MADTATAPSPEELAATEVAVESVDRAGIDQPIEVHVVSKDGVDEMAWQVADERIAKRTESTFQADPNAGRFRNMLRLAGHAITNPAETWRQVWVGRLARDHYRTEEHDDAIRTMREARNGIGSVMAPKGLDDAAAQAEDNALISRFSHELDQAVLHEGEEKRNVTENPQYAQVDTAIKTLIRELVNGRFATDLDFIQERNRVLEQVSRDNPELVANSMMYAENLRAAANQVRRAADETGKSTDRIVDEMKVFVDIANTGVRGEVQHDTLERVVGLLHGRSTDLIINEGVLATAASVAGSVFKVFGRTAVSAGSRIGFIGAGAATFAGLRERRMFHQEYGQHSRQAAMGETATGRRRNEIEQARIDFLSAPEATQAILSSLYIDGNPNRGIRTDITEDQFNTSLGLLTRAMNAVEASDTYNMTLVGYSSTGSIEQERLDLDIAIAQAQRDLRQLAADNPTFNGGQNFDELLTNIRLVNAEESGTHIQEGADTFRKIQRARAAKAAAMAAVMGAGIGMFVEEATSIINPYQEGLLDSVTGWNEGASSRSLLNGIFDKDALGLAADSHGGGGSAEHLTENLHSQDLSFVSKVNGLPEGYEFDLDYSGPRGNADLLDADGNVILNDLKLNRNGEFTAASLERMEEFGIKVDVESVGITGQEFVSERVTDHEFVRNHIEDVALVHRSLWYDNNTEAPVFDFNEVGLHGNYFDEQGNVHFDISTMTENGSFHADQVAEWQALAANGDMKVLVSVSEGTQSTPFHFDVSPEGHIVMPADHPAVEHLWVRGPNGEAIFGGRYVEVVQNLGANEYGVANVRPLATFEGPGMTSLVDRVPVPTEGTGHIYNMDFSSLAPEATSDLPVDGIFMPFVPRPGLEKADKAEFRGPYGNYYYGSESVGEAARWLEQHPDRHKPRKQIEDADGNKIWVEADGSPVERNIDREREQIEKYLGETKTNNPEYYRYLETLARSSTMGKMSERTRVSVNIPAYMEGKTIYQLLEEYVGQSDREGTLLDPSLYEINIIVNRKQGEAADSTVGEIKRFISEQRSAGNNWQINYVDVEFEDGKANVGYARKVITDLALMRSIARDNQDSPLYIESEDADLVRVDKQTVANLIRTLDEKPHLDIVSGIHDRDPETMKQNDMLFLSRRMGNFVERMMARKELRPESNPNWNYAFNRIYTVGWNVGYSAEAYALVGGYSPQPLAEDLKLGEQMTMVRGDGEMPNLDTVGRVYTRTDSSPRRYIVEVLRGRDAYSDGAFEDEDVNRKIRDMDLDELLEEINNYARIDSTNQNDFKNMFGGWYSYLKAFSPDTETAQRMFSRAMTFAGFKPGDYSFSADGNHVSISNFDNVKSALNNYRTRNP